MKNVIYVFLVIAYLAIGSEALALETCVGLCESEAKACEPIIAEFKKDRRTDYCGERYNGKNTGFPGLKALPQKCQESYTRFVDHALQLEKIYNTCESSKDCKTINVSFGLHINSKYADKIQSELAKEIKEWRPLCEINPHSDSLGWARLRDLSLPRRYQCIENMCIPDYSKSKN